MIYARPELPHPLVEVPCHPQLTDHSIGHQGSITIVKLIALPCFAHNSLFTKHYCANPSETFKNVSKILCYHPVIYIIRKYGIRLEKSFGILEKVNIAHGNKLVSYLQQHMRFH